MQATQPFLVYRDRIGVRSEVGFLRRQYVGFTRLRPVWAGRVVLPGAGDIGPDLIRIGGDGGFGPLRRLMFRHFGQVPAIDVPGLAPVLHAQFARGGALALPLAVGLGLRMAVTLHGGDVSKHKNWRGTLLAERWPALVREAGCFVCVSSAVAAIAEARGVPLAKLAVLSIGVEVPDRLPKREAVAHLFAGRFVEKKGIVVLADAVRRLRALGDPTPVVCVGDGPLRPVLESLARQVAGVTLTGWLPPDAVRAHMARAVSLLVPSIVAGDGDAEGLPSVIAEAMALGCPVIGSGQGGIAEAISDGRTGLLATPGDPQALADAMRRIVAEPQLGMALGLAGFAYAAAELNARVQSVKLESLLMSV